MRLIVLLTHVSIGLLITSVAGAKEPKIEESPTDSDSNRVLRFGKVRTITRTDKDGLTIGSSTTAKPANPYGWNCWRKRVR